MATTPVSLGTVTEDQTKTGPIPSQYKNLKPDTYITAKGATFTLTSTGWTYDPTTSKTLQALDTGESLTDTITVLNSKNGKESIGTISVTGVNDAPVGNAEPAAATTTKEDTPLTIDVLANDTDVDVEPLTITNLTQSTYGTVTIVSGKVLYTPSANYYGSDSFTYTPYDGTVAGYPVTVNITVTPVDDPTTVTYTADPAVTLFEDDGAKVVGTLSINDVDSTPTFAFGTQTGGTFTRDSSTGEVTFTPALDFNGTATAAYTVDGKSGTISVTVGAVNDTPIATGDAYSTNEDTKLVVAATDGVLTNDSDVESTTLKAVLISNVQNGALTLNDNGSFEYTPNANFNGADSFTYKVNDGTVDGNTVTVNLTVNSLEDPQVVNLSQTVTMLTEDAQATAVATLSITDADTTPAYTTVVFDKVEGGAFAYNPTTKEITFTPKADFSGAVSTKVFVDGSEKGIVNLTVTAVNDAPVAEADDGYVVDEDSSISTATPGVLANDTDPENDTLTAVLVDDVQHGTLTLNPNGSFTYIPEAGYNGLDSFTYKAFDGTDYSDIVTASLTVNAVNDAPTITTPTGTSDAPTFLIAENETGPVGTMQASDPDSSSLTWSLDPDNYADTFRFSINQTSGELTLNELQNFESTEDGADHLMLVRVGVTDGTAPVVYKEVFVGVADVDEAPTFVVTGGETTATKILFPENSVDVITTVHADDPEGDAVKYSIVPMTNGNVDDQFFTIDESTGALSFISAPDYEFDDPGSDHLYAVQVAAKDSAGKTTLRDVVVEVTDVDENTSPVITFEGGGDHVFKDTPENQLVIGKVTATDENGDNLIYEITGGVDQSLFAISDDGTLSWVKAPNYENPFVNPDETVDQLADVEVTVSDGHGGTDKQLITVNVTNVDEAPAAVGWAASSGSSLEGNSAYITVARSGGETDLPLTVNFSIGQWFSSPMPTLGTDYTITAGDDHSEVTINNATGSGTITFAAGQTTAKVAFNNLEDTLFENAELYKLTLDAGAGYSVTGENPIFNAINEDDLNSAPVFTFTGGTQQAPIQVAENTAGSFATLTATDSDGPSLLKYSINPTNPDPSYDQSFFSIDQNTGALKFISPPDFEFVDNGNDDLYKVQVTASDGNSIATRDVWVQVANDTTEIIYTPTVVGTVYDRPPYDGTPDGMNGGVGNLGFNINPFTDTAGPPANYFTHSQGVTEFKITEVDAVNRATLKVDWADNYWKLPATVEVYAYMGDGNLGLNDWDQGVLAGRATITTSDSINPQYALDLDPSVVSNVLAAGDWLGLNFRMPFEADGLAAPGFKIYMELDF